MKRNKHNLSSYNLTSLYMGKLYPVQTLEVLPGDSMKLSSSIFLRANPLVTPVMHPVHVRVHHFYVPSRILWDGFEDFITGGPDGLDTSTVPKITGSFNSNTVPDYMGVSIGNGTLSINALPVRAYNMVWNEFYRDQDIQNERNENDITIARVSWRKDYFTTSRPWQQKGPDLTLPLGDNPDLIGEQSNALLLASSDNAGFVFGQSIEGEKVVADLSTATGVTATEFREFFALQRYAEARAKYGSRYTEYLRYLGVTSSDARLQRPEYLGGGKTVVSFSDIPQTATDSTEGTPVGTLRGQGLGAMRSKPTRKYFEEHGYVITMLSIVPKAIYSTATPRMWWRDTKEDFYQKELSTIGEQAVLNKEIYADGTSADDDIFGYAPRYDEYRSQPSVVTGHMRTTFDTWHLARDFSVRPHLNDSFIRCDPTPRPWADQIEHQFVGMINHSVIARRSVNNVAISRVL